MNVALRRPMTREESFVWAEAQPGRYEFDGFQPVAMTGGTNKHGIIADNIRFELKGRLRGSPCQPMGSDGGGVATTGNKVRYPAAAVSCSEIPGNERLIPEPVIVFEVISPSSVRTDQVLKLREYHAVTSIKRYVVLEQTGRIVTVHARQDAEAWNTVVLLAEDVVPLPEVGIEIPVAALYDGVSLEESPGTAGS